jgi:anti-sigma regulatory factor (Ser/Thr protein kinase)
MRVLSEVRSFSATLDSLNPIREFLILSGKSIGLDNNRIYKLCLAVDEIATNIINYGYVNSGMKDPCIDITLISDNKMLTVTLEDTAMPFNPFEMDIPGEKELSLPLEQRPIGGLGILLAKNNVDEFLYKYEKGKNKNIFLINLN